MSRHFISQARSVVPACDVDLDTFKRLVKATASVEKIGAYKIGFSLALTHGLSEIVKVARGYTSKPLIYDHQKAGTDIPDTGELFANIVATAKVDAVIFFPQSGPLTLRAWTQAAQHRGLHVIVGGRMTHDQYVKSRGGYIADDAIMRMYEDAIELGVRDFVVPGNQSTFIKDLRDRMGDIARESVFYAPGFVMQGGDISEAGHVAGPNWHAIVGRAIYDQPDMRRAAIDLTAKL